MLCLIRSNVVSLFISIVFNYPMGPARTHWLRPVVSPRASCLPHSITHILHHHEAQRPAPLASPGPSNELRRHWPPALATDVQQGCYVALRRYVDQPPLALRLDCHIIILCQKARGAVGHGRPPVNSDRRVALIQFYPSPLPAKSLAAY